MDEDRLIAQKLQCDEKALKRYAKSVFATEKDPLHAELEAELYQTHVLFLSVLETSLKKQIVHFEEQLRMQKSNLHAKRQQTHLLQQQIAASKEQHVLELQYEALTQQIVAFDGVEAMKAELADLNERQRHLENVHAFHADRVKSAIETLSQVAATLREDSANVADA